VALLSVLIIIGELAVLVVTAVVELGTAEPVVVVVDTAAAVEQEDLQTGARAAAAVRTALQLAKLTHQVTTRGMV
jgi:hypothetical protein